jgi:hypothetical protein
LILSSLCNILISSLKARFSGLLRHFGIDVPFDIYRMSERFSDPIFLIVPLLDPRFKLLWLDHLNTVVKMRVLEKIHEAFVHLFSRVTVHSTHVARSEASSTNERGVAEPVPQATSVGPKRKCLFPYLNHNKKVQCDDKTQILTELDAFLCETNCDPDLLFIKKTTYPCLYQLGLKYLSVPATSASIERIFSQSGFLMRPHRSRLTSKNVCLLTFLKCNQMLL